MKGRYYLLILIFFTFFLVLFTSANLVGAASFSCSGGTCTYNFTVTETWQVPNNVLDNNITIRAWGGGGAGAGRTSNGRTGGGGGGAFASSNIIVTPGENLTIRVGGSVAGTTGSGANGIQSNVSWQNNTLAVRAAGGSGGTTGAGGTGGTVTSSSGTIRYAGGNGYYVNSGNGGGGGGGAGTNGAGANATSSTGATGASLYGGNGGTGVQDPAGTSGNGSDYGGGGAGLRRTSGNRIGGTGAQGFVQIIYQEAPLSLQINSCRQLNVSGTTYILTGNVSSTGTCFTVTQPNITLDCNGYRINYSTNGNDNTYGVYSNQFNTTIKNCNIVDGNTISVYEERYGIFFESASNGVIFNNTVLTNNSGSLFVYSDSNYNNISKNIFSSNFSSAISLVEDSNFNLIENNTALSIEGASIFLYGGSTYNTLINNNATSRDGAGIFVYADSDYNTLINNTGVGGPGEYGIYVAVSENNLFINNTAISNSEWGFGTHIRLSSNNTFVEHTSIGISPNWPDMGQSIYLYNSHNNLFRDCINITGGMVDLYVEEGSSNNTFLNCSYDLNKEEIDGSGEIIRKWYYQAYVNDTLGNPLIGINVSARNSTGHLQFTQQTNSSGLIGRQEVIEYINRDGVVSRYSNYTIGAYLEGHPPAKNHIIDFTQTRNKVDDWFTIREPDSTPPLITIISPVGTVADVTLLINISLSEEARVWYSVDGGQNITLCEECDFSDNKFLYLNEGEHIFRVFANDSSGNFNFNVFSLFTIDMKNNYYDDFEDNSSLYSLNNVTWGKGNISFKGKFNYLDDPNLVSIYLFNDSNNLGFDLKGNNNMTTVRSDPARSTTIPAGRTGYSIDLDGNDQVCISSGFTFNPSQSHTMCFWVRKASIIDDGNAFAQHCVYDTWGGDGEYIFTANNCGSDKDDIYIPGAISSNTWVHICQKYDSNNRNMTIYVNGFENTSKILNYPIEHSLSNPWCIGGCNGDCFMQGQVFEPMWFDRQLNSDEISSIYSGGSYFSSGNFTSYPINTTWNITEITNITWTEVNTNANNNITVQVSADGGIRWYNATSGNALPQIFTGNNNSLVYRVIFSTIDSPEPIAISDMNISWSSEIEISEENACGVLNETGTTYVLTQDVSSTETCFDIAAENITLDCNGYWINYSTSGDDETYGVYSNQFNTTIKNCNIVDGNPSSENKERKGILLEEESHFANILNNNITTSKTAINLRGVNNTLLVGNFLNATDIGESAIHLHSSCKNTLVNNTFYGGDYVLALEGQEGEYLNTQDNLFMNNRVFTGLSTGCATLVQYASNNTFINESYYTSEGINVWLTLSYNNLFRDCVFTGEDSNPLDTGWDPDSINNTFVNCTYNEIGANLPANEGPDNWFLTKWYYQTYVNDTNGNPLSNVNITAYNRLGLLEFTALTDENGRIALQDITNYNITSKSGTTYFSNYTISAVAEGYGSSNKQLNITLTKNKLDDFFTLEESIFGEPIQTCRQLNETGTTYVLTENVSSIGTCFTVTSPNIVLNCNGHWINYSTGGGADTHGVYSNQFNTTIKNCNIVDGNWTSEEITRYGLVLTGSDNSTVYNNYVNVSSSTAIYLAFTNDFNNITNNIGESSFRGIYFSGNSSLFINNIARGNSSHGFDVGINANNNLFINNSGTTNTGVGLYIASGSMNNIFINCTGISASNHGVTLAHNSYNIFIGLNAKSLSGFYRAISILDSNHSLFRDCENISGYYTVYVAGGSISINNTFVNCSYNIGGEDIATGSELTRKGYYQAYVNDTGGNPLSGVNVSARNSTGHLQFTQQTNSSGLIDRQEITEYVNRGGTRTYYSNYTINASLEGQDTLSKQLNLTLTRNKLDDFFTFEEVIFGEQINSCRQLNETGTTYVLTQNVSSTGTCFTVTRPNVVLDCNGNWINYSTSGNEDTYGFYSNQFNTTIKNCNVVDGNWTNSAGDYRYSIYFDGADYGTILNNYVSVNNSQAIFLGDDADFNNVINNTAYSGYHAIDVQGSNNFILDNSANSTGIFYGWCAAIIIYGGGVGGGYNNTLINNTVLSRYTGISISNGANHNFLLNNSARSTEHRGVQIAGSDNNILISQESINFEGGSYYALSLVGGSKNTIIRDCRAFITPYGSAVDLGWDPGAVNNSFINCSYEDEFVPQNNSELIRKWYYQAHVMDTLGNPLSNANVTAYNSTGHIQFTAFTNSSGYIPKQEVIAYINYGGYAFSNVFTYHDNYTISVTRVGYENSESKTYNFSRTFNIIDDSFTLTGEGIQCGVLDSANTVYALTGNVSSTGTCFTITQPNITLDCNGYWINYSIGGVEDTYGVYSNQFNTTVKNCNIIDGNWSSVSTTRHAISLYNGAHNSSIINSNLTTNNSRVINLDRTSYVNIANNTISSNYMAIYLLDNCRDSNIENNKILVHNTGIFLYSDAHNSVLKNNYIYQLGGEGQHGIYLVYTDNATIINNTIEGMFKRGFSFYGSNNTVISNINITGPEDAFILWAGVSNNNLIKDCVNLDSTSYDFYVGSGASGTNNTILNCSYNSNKEHMVSGSELIRKWYYQAYVNDTSGNPLMNVNVSARNSTNQVQFTQQTKGSGLIDRQEITEYINRGGTRTYYSNYTINASLAGQGTLSKQLNLTLTKNKLDDFFTFEEVIFGEQINSCRQLNETGITYTLTQNVFSTGTCFNVTRPNVVLDCRGHWINYTGTGSQNAYGLYTNQFNTTLKNCNIYNYTIGAYYHGASNGTIQNNTIQIYQNRSLSMDHIEHTDSFTPMASGILLYDYADYNLILNTTSYSQYGRGIYLNGASNNTIINSNGTSDSNPGIQIYEYIFAGGVGRNNTVLNSYAYSNSHIGLVILHSGWNEIINSTILSNSSQWDGYALAIQYSENNKIINTTAHAFDRGGILVLASDNTLVLNSIGISDGVNSPGISVEYGTFNSVIANSTGIAGTTYSASCGIVISQGTYSPSSNITLVDSIGISVSEDSAGICIGGSNNTVRRSTAIGGVGYRIDWDATDILVEDCVNTTGSSYGVYSHESADVDVTFLNCSYDGERIQSSISNLTRKWYYQAYVNDTVGNPLPNVNVTAYNLTGHLQFTQQTNSSGLIDRQEVIEYVNRGGVISRYSNYTIGAYLEGYPPAKNHTIDFENTQNKIDDWFTIREPDFTPPLITIISPVGTIADVTPLINISLSEEARIWYSVDGGQNITLCDECDFSDDRFLYLNEGEHIFRVFANDSSGNFNTTFVSFTIDMKNNYYDDFEDNSSIYSLNNVVWNKGNVSFKGDFNYLEDSNLVSVYLFNNLNNLGLDLKGNNHMFEEIGTPSRSTTIPSGKTGYSINLPGGSEVCIPYGFTFNPSQDHTMCFWVRKTQLGEGGNAFAQHCTYDTWDNNREYVFTANNCGAIDEIYIPGVFSRNTWVHICQNYNSNSRNMTIYVNGAMNTSKRLDYQIEYNPSYQWCIGGCYGGCFMQGQVFEPMWFDRQLSSDEISSIYSGGNYYSLGNFTSYPINTTENITRITNITWTEVNTNTNNNITVQVSADGGVRWYDATSGNALPQIFTGNNNSLVYRVIFSTFNSSISIAISDMNISWSNKIEIPGENACGVLNETGKTYVLTEDVSSTGTCFTVTSPNIVLDCNGHWINYSIGGEEETNGVYSNQFNTTIKNCNIVDGNWSSELDSREGIYIDWNSNASTLLNNWVNTSSSYAIMVSRGQSFNNLTNNTGISISLGGIYYSAHLGILENNTGISGSQHGIDIGWHSYNNILINNTGISSGSSGIIVYFSENNTLINCTGIHLDGYGSGVRVAGSSNITFYGLTSRGSIEGVRIYEESSNISFKDCKNISGGSLDIRIFEDSINNSFINCSYTTGKEDIATGSELIRKWYYQAYVNDTSGNPLGDVSVLARNSTGHLQFTQQTNSSGWIQRQELTEYVNRGGTRSYYNPSSVEASKSGYKTNTTEHNITILHNILLYITLEPNSCACPGLNMNWALNMSEYCNITVDCNLGVGNITFIERGETRFNATISTANMQYPLSEQTLFISSRGIVNIG